LRLFPVIIIGFLLPVAIGCQGPWSASTDQAPITALPTTPTPPATTASNISSQAADSPAEKNDEATLAEVLDELTEVGAVDPEAKRVLMADLRAAKPENWPLIVRQFRAALAFRKQLIERERLAAQQERAVAGPTPMAQTALTTAEPVLPRSQAELTAAAVQQMAPTSLKSQPTAIATAGAPHSALPATPIPTTLPAQRRPSPEATQVLSQPPPQLLQQISYNTDSTAPQDWRGHLQTAIHDLQTSVPSTPGSTDEVNEHLRLRLLQLLAGDEEGALAPIPGATATKQDYWNQQLFAVSTYLDSKTQPNDKQRAASSLLHLDGARAKLAELATLQVRKLTFVESVEGYGAYKPTEITKFSPGKRVTLYAEIENFTSEPTKKGYRTQLGTSYEIVDENGKRIDSAQFPEVEDLCQNPRRDFHMQYTVTLPMRIPADHYELRLIITDQQSHKIGQSSLPFEITE